MNKCCSFITSCLDPFKRNRMVFSNIATHIQNNISITKINIMVCHCTATERLCQSRYSCAVSYAGLMFDIDEAERPEELLKQPAFFIIQSCAAYRSYSISSINHLSIGVLFHNALITAIFDISGDFIKSPFPTDLFPTVAVRSTIADFLKAIIINSYLIRCGTFGTQCAFADWMIRVTLSINHFSLLVCGYQYPTSHRTKTAYSGGLLGTFDPEFCSKLGSINLSRG